MAAKNDAKTTPFQTVDTDKVMAAQQRNIDAFASAGQIVVDGVKAIAQRQSEMVQGSVDLWMAASQSTFSGMCVPLTPVRPTSSSNGAGSCEGETPALEGWLKAS
jgi:hypothetical protein